jgi:mono/diheme cytochrome c family protein
VTTVNTAARDEKIRVAGATFNTLCIVCHGADGRGMAAVRTLAPALPDFTSHDWHTTRSNSQLATSIMEGKGTMPPWNTQMTADRARDLALFVRSFGAPELMAETPAASTPSTAEFAREIQSLRQKFDDIEKQLQALATASPSP